MNLAERLKIDTASSHEKLEKIIVQLIQRLTTAQDYIYLLGLFYSYFAGIEDLINQKSFVLSLPEFRERRKASFISADILAMRGDVPWIAGVSFLPVIENSFQAFGALYVLEGSTLGGTQIVKMIRRNLGSEPGSYRFFSGYEDQNAAMWNKFKSILNHLSEEEKDIRNVLSGAEDTFLKFAEWIITNKNAQS